MSLSFVDKEEILQLIAMLLVMCLFAGVTNAQTLQAQDSKKDIIAVVLGKEITVKDKDRLGALILGTLLKQFAKDNKIEPTEEELETFIWKTENLEKQHQIKLEEDRRKLVAELRTTALSEHERKDKESQLQTIQSTLKTTREMKDQTKEKKEQLRPIKRKLTWQLSDDGR